MAIGAMISSVPFSALIWIEYFLACKPLNLLLSDNGNSRIRSLTLQINNLQLIVQKTHQRHTAQFQAESVVISFVQPARFVQKKPHKLQIDAEIAANCGLRKFLKVANRFAQTIRRSKSDAADAEG